MDELVAMNKAEASIFVAEGTGEKERSRNVYGLEHG